MIRTIFFDLGDTLVRSDRTWLPGAQALLQTLKSNGFELGIISNTGNLTSRAQIMALLPDDFNVNVFNDALVLFSSELGIAKPEPRIFQQAMMRANRPASECLFCTENLLDTLVAQQQGMQTLRVQTSPNSDLAAIPGVLADYHALS